MARIWLAFLVFEEPGSQHSSYPKCPPAPSGRATSDGLLSTQGGEHALQLRRTRRHRPASKRCVPLSSQMPASSPPRPRAPHAQLGRPCSLWCASGSGSGPRCGRAPRIARCRASRCVRRGTGPRPQVRLRRGAHEFSGALPLATAYCSPHAAPPPRSSDRRRWPSGDACTVRTRLRDRAPSPWPYHTLAGRARAGRPCNHSSRVPHTPRSPRHRGLERRRRCASPNEIRRPVSWSRS